MILKPHRVPLSALLLSAAVLSGCSTVEPGSPSPAGTGSPATSGASSTSSAPQAVPDACALLEKVAGEFSVTNVEKSSDGEDCDGDLPEVRSIAIQVYPDLGLAQYNPIYQAVVSDIDVNGRRGKLVEKALTKFDCAVVLELTETSRVDVFASASVTNDSCAVAQQIAKAIEPDLPRS
ncbi:MULTISPECIES: DUF3558 domain-containing protein [Actinosynnema]|uniref:DUF3558 domain-containing protein n=1 Tax=Actinosynnema TaxID=40566 RepID=UPI0020A4C13C|nr:DUF3558 domain-containing protein [Actinosynnema pretiosum]MCP2099318.1 hypothetical protein [Actinosynnema pretiosum]